jgi:hypothetical protein
MFISSNILTSQWNILMDYPRVTEVLKSFTNYDKVPTQILQRAAAKGTSVHAICAGIANGAWIPDGMIEDELKGYVSSFKKWVEAQVKEFVVVEKRYTHDQLKYSGQLDFVIRATDNELYLVDLKTSSQPQKTYPVQMAAYNLLLKNDQIKVKGAMLVYLSKDGEFPEIHLIEDMSQETWIFLCALDCWYYFKKGKTNVRENTGIDDFDGNASTPEDCA